MPVSSASSPSSPPSARYKIFHPPTHKKLYLRRIETKHGIFTKARNCLLSNAISIPPLKFVTVTHLRFVTNFYLLEICHPHPQWSSRYQRTLQEGPSRINKRWFEQTLNYCFRIVITPVLFMRAPTCPLSSATLTPLSKSASHVTSRAFTKKPELALSRVTNSYDTHGYLDWYTLIWWTFQLFWCTACKYLTQTYSSLDYPKIISRSKYNSPTILACCNSIF